VIRRHPDIKVLRRAADIEQCAARQRRLLTQVWPLLAPGGMLVYTTCSILRTENEDVIAEFLGLRPDAREQPIAAEWGRAMRHGRQILPGEKSMDGFYYARLLKSA
jgi:16S rRNA (cytosine967-C5)-methyltransferase